MDSETTIWLLQPSALCPAQHHAGCHTALVAKGAELALGRGLLQLEKQRYPMPMEKVRLSTETFLII